MPNLKVIDLTIGGVSIRVQSPVELAVPREMEPFLTPGAAYRFFYDVVLIDEPLVLPDTPEHWTAYQQEYKRTDGWLRVFSYLTTPDGCATALLLRPSGHHSLYIPRSDLERYQTGNSLSPILGLDHVLMQADCFLLHSSVVRYREKTLLFSGPSGVGKSTQADLWHQILGAEILNGDRCCLAYRQGQFTGCGSPYAGSSNIYTPGEAPIQAIFLLSQGPENRIIRVTGRQAFIPLYSQCLTNNWDEAYTTQLCVLLDKLIAQVPIYTLTCQPDREAVEMALGAAFQEGA